jgi:hypothetical protein
MEPLKKEAATQRAFMKSDRSRQQSMPDNK